MKPLKRYRLKLNNVNKIEELLQELYNEACSNIQQIQNEMNKISSSVNLNDEIVEAKAKYAKAMNDFMSNKDKAIGRKLEIAKLMTEIMKFDGNVDKTMQESDAVGNWAEFVEDMEKKSGMLDDSKKPEDEKIEYRLR